MIYDTCLVASRRPVIILGEVNETHGPCDLISETYQVIQQFCLGIEFVNESRKAEGSLPAQVDQRVKLGVECTLQENHPRVCDRNS